MHAAGVRFSALVVLAALGPLGCGWLEKTVECRAFTSVSRAWGERAEVFGRELEANVTQQLEGIEQMDVGSRADLMRYSRALRSASDTLDERADGFFGEAKGGFEQLTLTDPQLVTYRADYVAQVDDVGLRIRALTAAVRHLGEIFGRIDPHSLSSESRARGLERELKDVEVRIGAAERELERAIAAEERVVEQVNAYCRPAVPPRRVASL